MRRLGTGLVAILALTIAIVQPAAAVEQDLSPGTMIDWSEDQATTFTYGDITIALSFTGDEDYESEVTLTISAPGAQPQKIVEIGGGMAFGRIGVFAMDDSGADTVLFSVYSGGAHCCMQTSAITRTADGLVVESVGAIDGDLVEPFDVDGDGRIELVLYDDRFNYTFSAYAFSRPAQQIFKFRDGIMVDASREPQYAAFYRRQLEDLASGCGGAQGWLKPDCAGYLATAALLGEFDARFPAVKAAFDAGKGEADSGWEVISLCQDAECATTTDYDSFSEAIVIALTQWGYLDSEPAAKGESKDKLNSR